MRSLVKKILFGNYNASQFVGVGIAPEKITEKCTLMLDYDELNVSNDQWILCQDPFIIGIFLKDMPVHKKCKLIITHNEHSVASLIIQPFTSVSIGSGNLILFKILKTNCSHLSTWHRLFLLSYFYYKKKEKIAFEVAKQFCASYSFPRKVVLISFKDENSYNFFPMDFQGYIKANDHYILGLRHTNITLNKILQHKRIVVCDISADDLELIYALGKHHSKHPPALDKLPFNINESANYKFHLPSFVLSYKELKVVNHLNLGSHMLLISQVEHKETLRDKQNILHHIHFIQFLEEQAN